MTQNSSGDENKSLVQEEIALAESQEQAELNAATKAYLQKRVVALRVENNRLQTQLDGIRVELDVVLEQNAAGSESPDPD